MADGDINAGVNTLVPTKEKNVCRTFALFGGYLLVIWDACNGKNTAQLVAYGIVTTGPTLPVAGDEMIPEGVTGFTTSGAFGGRPVLKEGQTKPKTTKAPEIPVQQKCVQSARRDGCKPCRGEDPLLGNETNLVSRRSLAFEVITTSFSNLLSPPGLGSSFLVIGENGRWVRSPFACGMVCGTKLCRKGIQCDGKIKRQSFAHLIRVWHERNGWNHKVLPALAEALDLGRVHNSQISMLRNGKLASPGPEVFLALGRINQLLAAEAGPRGLMPPLREQLEDRPELLTALDSSALAVHLVLFLWF